MKRSFFTVIALVMALLVPASALAGNGNGGGNKPPAPVPAPVTTLTIMLDPGSVIAPLAAMPDAGSPSNSGCGVATVRSVDGYGNYVTANKHWCWSYGSISQQYGWGDYGTCWLFCSFNGWHYNFGFDRGWQDKGEFKDVGIGGLAAFTNTDQACVYVYGNGTATGC